MRIPISFSIVLLCAALLQAADQKGNAMDSIKVTIQDKPEMFLVGIAGYGSPDNMKIGDMWGRFSEVDKDIPNKINNEGTYGLMIYPPKFPNPWEFTYLAAVRVSNLNDIPIQMLGKRLPKSKYAVFSVPGGPDKIKDTYQYAYQTWLPGSEYDAAFPFDFEFYQEEKGKQQCASPLFVYIPIKPKSEK
jgi:AraC family transcriptional regulator